MKIAKRALAFCLDFLREHTRSSSARLIAILCAVVGSLLGLAAAALVWVIVVQLWHHTLDMATLGQLSDLLKNLSWPIGCFIGGGAVAIVTRNKTGVTPEDDHAPRSHQLPSGAVKPDTEPI